MTTIPYQRHSDESRAAAEAIEPAAGTLRRQVLDAIRAAGEAGLTDNEGVAALSMNPSTYRPRRIELADAGLVCKSGRKRDGSAVWVYRVAKVATLF